MFDNILETGNIITNSIDFFLSEPDNGTFGCHVSKKHRT
jgi:hypothetical protein